MSADQLRLGLRVPGGRKPRPEASRRRAGDRYAMGARQERRACDALRRKGWTPVRSAGSKGPADVVAVNQSGQVLAIQVKAGQSQPGPSARRDALTALRAAYPSESVAVELWYWPTDSKRRAWIRFREGESA